jgi:hypothetical protein
MTERSTRRRRPSGEILVENRVDIRADIALGSLSVMGPTSPASAAFRESGQNRVDQRGR